MIIEIKHTKILLCGPAAAGKSSFCHLLFRSKFSSKYNSTDIMDTKQAITVKNYGMFKEEDEVVWVELDHKGLLQHFKTLLKSHAFKPSDPLNKQSLHQSKAPSSPSQHVEASNSDASNVLSQQQRISSQELQPLNTPSQQVQYPSPNVAPDIAHTVPYNHDIVPKLDVEKSIMNSSALPDSLEIGDAVKLITVLDSGGQPEYISLLPAINSMPTINFMVHDLTKMLDDPVLVRYKTKEYKEAPRYFLNYSNLDMIQLLMCLNTDSVESTQELLPQRIKFSVPEKSYIGFVGTHHDEIKSNLEILQTVNNKLSCITKERNCKHVLRAEKSLVFPVDNTTAGDSRTEDTEVKRIRKKVEDITNNIKPKELPVTWMIMELEMQQLRNGNIKYISFEEYKKIALENASIVDEMEIKTSLTFFHNLGIVAYFEFCDNYNWIVIDLQWLFTNLAKIMHLSLEDVIFDEDGLREMFQEKRLLAKQLFEKKGGYVKLDGTNQEELQNFIKILKHLKVITDVNIENDNYYYLLCSLPSTMQYSDNCRILLSEPMLIRFSSGFLPRGFFCSLVAHLLMDTPDGWEHQLGNDAVKHYSNVMTFYIMDKIYLCLHDKIYYLELQVKHFNKDANTSHHCDILPDLEKRMIKVCDKLKFDYNKIEYGFYCHADEKYSTDDHIAVFQSCLPKNNILTCTRKPPHKTKIGEAHRIWFKEVCSIKFVICECDTDLLLLHTYTFELYTVVFHFS